LTQRFKTLVTNVNVAVGRLKAERDRLTEEKRSLEKVSSQAVLYGAECDALRVVGEVLRERIRERVERLVTLAVRSVFGREDLRFELKMELARGQMTARPMLVTKFRNEEILLNVLDGKGGGLVDVVSFVLQVIVLVLTKPAVTKTMFLDERFSHVRDEIGKVSELLATLHEMTGIQFVVVTKEQVLADGADKVFRMDKDAEGVARVRVES